MKTKNPMNQLAGKQKIKNNIAKILNNLLVNISWKMFNVMNI